MRRILPVLSVLCLAISGAFAQSEPPSSSDTTIIKQDDGNALMWEVPAKVTPPSRAAKQDAQRIREQAQMNQAEIMQDVQSKNTLPPMDNGMAPGAMMSPYVPFSTVPSPGFNVTGRTWTPFRVRDFSYGGTSQSFGAPMFSGVEVPTPMFGYPTGGVPVQLPVPVPGVQPWPANNTMPNRQPNLQSAPSPSLAVPRQNTLLPESD